MLLKRLPDGSKQKRWLPGWFESLIILAALLLVFSDHKTVLCNSNFPCDFVSSASVASRVLTPYSASHLSAAFEVSPLLCLNLLVIVWIQSRQSM